MVIGPGYATATQVGIWFTDFVTQDQTVPAKAIDADSAETHARAIKGAQVSLLRAGTRFDLLLFHTGVIVG
jgi:hypothetical protein